MAVTALAAETSALLLIDFQGRLMPAIAEGEARVAQAAKLASAARILDVPTLLTEQNPRGLGGTDARLAEAGPVLEKMTFDASRAPGFADALPDRPALVVAGCEAHVCVLQTVLGLRAMGRAVAVVADAVGSRLPANRDLALARMAGAGAQIVSTEMVLFEWLGSAENSRFRDVLALIK